MFHVPNRFRRRTGVMGSSDADGNCGSFKIPSGPTSFLLAIASEEFEWEHVSVSAYMSDGTRTPTWSDMCDIKRLFWDAEDVVMQLHPPESQYVNNHPNVLHLWRPKNAIIPMPPLILV